MIVVDSSVWIDHLRTSEPRLVVGLLDGTIIQHPFVTVELSLGSLSRRNEFIPMLGRLPQADIVENAVLLQFIETHEVFGTGIGLVDVHLLASVAEYEGARLWTSDKRLFVQAERLGLAFSK